MDWIGFTHLHFFFNALVRSVSLGGTVSLLPIETPVPVLNGERLFEEAQLMVICMYC